MGRKLKAGIICSEFNQDLVQPLYSEAVRELASCASPEAGETPGEKPKASRRGQTAQFMDLSRPWPFSALKKESGREAPVAIKPFVRLVPGAGEIPLMARWMIERQKAEGVLALGAIVKGETGHYDFLRSFLERALWDLQREYGLPVIFSVLMLESRAQAASRIKRGGEAARAFAEMLRLSAAL